MLELVNPDPPPAITTFISEFITVLIIANMANCQYRKYLRFVGYSRFYLSLPSYLLGGFKQAEISEVAVEALNRCRYTLGCGHCVAVEIFSEVQRLIY